MSETIDYIHLAPRDGSSYHQFFVKGRNLRAETLYRATVGSEPMTPDDVARDYDVPVEAVREAIHYCATRRCSSGNARRTGPRANPAARSPLRQSRRVLASSHDDLPRR